jgi:hypothetical protein
LRRSTALACLAAIGVADYVIKRRPPRWILVAFIDHPAHVATAMLIHPKGNAAYLVGSLLPDIDHIPVALRPVKPSLDDARPASHCLLAVAPVAAFNRAAAAGMLAHYARDIAVGTGVPLLWPAARRSLRVPYPVYVAGCLLLARRATLVDGL